MKIRCTLCGASNETAPDFDTAFCLNCGSSILVSDALAYRFHGDLRKFLTENELVKLAKEAHNALKFTPETLELLTKAAPSGDVEVNYLIGMHYFNEKEYTLALPYLYVAAERMYPDGLCLYAVAKYLLDPENKDAYPRIHKYLSTARDTCSKIFEQINGEKLLRHIDSVSDPTGDTKKLPDIPDFTELTE